MILMNHPEHNVSEKTTYNYIEKGYISVINLDLQSKVKYKLRHCHESKINDKSIFEGRTYKDFQELLKLHPDMPVVEMDTVVGRNTEEILCIVKFCIVIYNDFSKLLSIWWGDNFVFVQL